MTNQQIAWTCLLVGIVQGLAYTLNGNHFDAYGAIILAVFTVGFAHQIREGKDDDRDGG